MIVILGAGLAGLSAAQKLIEFGFKDLLIIEAKERPGGRIESRSNQGGTRFDLGAQWLHGERENPIYNWLKDLDLIEGPEEDEIEFEGLFKTQEGKEPDKGVVRRVLELLLDAKHILYETSSILDTKCKPVDLFRNHIKLESRNCPILKIADSDMIEAILNWFELFETIDNSCEQLQLLSLRAYSDWTDFDNGQVVRLRGGWRSLVDKLVNLIGRDKFLFGCPVRRLSLTDEGKVKIQLSTTPSAATTTTATMTTGSIITCDHVIVTFSLGVLKNLPMDFFDPPLSSQRLEGLKKSGFGVINKIFLEFDEPFLQEERGLKLLWPKVERESDPLLPEWTKFMTGFDLVSGQPKVLLAWIGGEGAKMMEQFSNEELGETCLEVLERFLPEKKNAIPKLVSVVHSNWYKDEFIKGAYSYESIEGLNFDKKTIWEPICWETKQQCNNSNKTTRIPKIQFAGEATALSMYATAHGAIVSGWREAEVLKKLLIGRRSMKRATPFVQANT